MIETRRIGREFDAKIEVFEGCKYTAHSMADLGEIHTAKYYGITSWDIISGEDAKEIEEGLNENDCDELHEYLVIRLADGQTSTFRNSHTDMRML